MSGSHLDSLVPSPSWFYQQSLFDDLVYPGPFEEDEGFYQTPQSKAKQAAGFRKLSIGLSTS
jgi:hypothetical protein